MLRKYIPRAFPNLAALAGIRFNPSSILGTKFLRGLCSESVLGSFEKLQEIGRLDREADAFNAQLIAKLGKMGFPPMKTGFGQAPFDILSDYFRSTVGAFCDQIDQPEMMERACYMFADIQIESYAYFKTAQLPVKRVFFPLHKGMDGFMSPEQYERLYWRPLRKVIDALVDMDVVPILYGEGPYNSRIDQMTDIPVGKTIIHFERADMEKAKKVLGDKACISGNFPIGLLERGTRQQVIDEVKRLADICAPGGGWIFDTDACIANANQENVEAMFDTIMTYGKY
jgi:uroporphyrinogen-III decarboxylase